MTVTSVLLTGASGYVGGSVLAAILAAKRNGTLPNNIRISALVRSSRQAEALYNIGVMPVQFDGLHDLARIKEVASQHDIVIHCASSQHVESAVALVQGLDVRRQKTGRDVFLVHTSGTSNFADLPITHPTSVAPRVFSEDDDLWEYEKEHADANLNGAVDVALVEESLELGVKSVIVNLPMIYGAGTGLFHQHSVQIPALINFSLVAKQAVVLGEGKGTWSPLHIDDAAALYITLLSRILTNPSSLRYNKTGYYIPRAGFETTWLEIASLIAKAGVAQGFFYNTDLKSLTPREVAQTMRSAGAPEWLDETIVEAVWASNARVPGEKCAQLGWKAVKDRRDFLDSFDAEVKAIAEEMRS